MSTYADALAAAIEAAKLAGDHLRAERHRPEGPRGQDEHAEADKEAERLIRDKLLAARDWGYRGKEMAFRQTPSGESHLWLVDPNDGTAAFLKGQRGSAVSIAALRDGVPVLGVVFAFAYPDDRGDLIAWAEGCGSVTRNGQPATPLPQAGLAVGQFVLVSQGADTASAANARCVAPARFVALPSIAYRLALSAAGDAVGAVCLRGPWSGHGPHGWDYGAGHALLRGAGGILLDEKGQEITYQKDGTSEVRACFGGSKAAATELARRSWAEIFKPATIILSPGFDLTRLEIGKTIADSGVLARAQGCWLGQLVGDALGQLVEFQSAEEIAKHYPDGVRHMADGGVYNLLAGQPTDDSELALILARALILGGRHNPAEVLAAYRHWFRSGPFDIGGTIRAALTTGEPSADRPTNGSLMRISPLGIFGWRDSAAAGALAGQDSNLTHAHPLCTGSCAAFVAALATAIRAGCAPDAVHAAAVAEVERNNGPAELREALSAARTTPPADYFTNQGFVLIALQNAFYQLLHAPSLEEGVVATIAKGGDTDTNAAIAGALLGAVHGREAIPRTWRSAVLSCRPLVEYKAKRCRPAEFWPVDALEIAERLLLAADR